MYVCDKFFFILYFVPWNTGGRGEDKRVDYFLFFNETERKFLISVISEASHLEMFESNFFLLVCRLKRGYVLVGDAEERFKIWVIKTFYNNLS